LSQGEAHRRVQRMCLTHLTMVMSDTERNRKARLVQEISTPVSTPIGTYDVFRVCVLVSSLA